MGNAAFPMHSRPAPITLPLTIRAPAVPGEYVLEIDMVEEGVTWFKDKGALCAFVSVVVTRRRSRTQMKELEELRIQLDTVGKSSRGGSSGQSSAGSIRPVPLNLREPVRRVTQQNRGSRRAASD